MNTETITVETNPPIGWVTLNRPEQFNTFSSRMALELNEALEALDMADDVRVIVISGAGKAFSTGIDINEFHGKTPAEYQAWISLMDRMHFTISAMAKPVIAMVHGFAVANGAGLMAAADFAVVAEDTKIGTTAINVGLLCTGPIIPLSYALGKAKTLEMLLCGDMILAQDALEMGLVNRVVPREELEKETIAFAEKLCSKSPAAIRMGKAFYYQMIDMPFRQRFAHNSEVFARLCTTRDAKEGVSAFMEKRKPAWSGK